MHIELPTEKAAASFSAIDPTRKEFKYVRPDPFC
jgi:hypothetical protein